MNNFSANILIVEDETPFREVLAATLKAEGHTVAVSNNGRAAEVLLRSRPFNLILTDIIMPEKDGLEVIMNLHAAKNSIPIIAMTGSHAFTDVYLKTAKALGATRVLAKPFEMRELLNAIRETLE